MADANDPTDPKPLSGTVRFDYLKSNLFRVLHIDGVHGGVRPDGMSIHMALFNERNAIPQSEEFEVTEGRVGELIKGEGRPAIVREVEVDVIVDINAARAIRDWLGQMVQAAESVATKLNKRAE